MRLAQTIMLIMLMSLLPQICISCFTKPSQSQPEKRGDYYHERIEKLANADYATRSGMSMSFQEGCYTKECIDELIDALGSENPILRANAAFMFYVISPFSEPALHKLYNLLNDENKDVRMWAGLAIAKIKPADPEALPSVLEALSSDDESSASALTKVIGPYGAKGKDVVPLLVEELDAKNTYGQIHVIQTLGDIGPDSSPAIPKLIKLLQKDNSYVREAVVTALGKIGADAIPPLIEILGMKENHIYYFISDALGKIGPTAVPALIGKLKDDDPQVRKTAIGALGKIGPQAESAIPFLIKALRDTDRDVQVSASSTLGQIGEAAVPELLIIIRDYKNNESCWLAVHAIGAMGSISAPYIAELYESSDPMIREIAIAAYSVPNSCVDEAFPILQRASTDESPKIRHRAIQNLSLYSSKYGNDVKMSNTLIETFIKTLADKDEKASYAACYALANMGKDCNAVAPALVATLGTEIVEVRILAIKALGQLGTKAAFTLPKLEIISKDSSYPLERFAAEASIEKIKNASNEKKPCQR